MKIRMNGDCHQLLVLSTTGLTWGMGYFGEDSPLLSELFCGPYPWLYTHEGAFGASTSVSDPEKATGLFLLLFLVWTLGGLFLPPESFTLPSMDVASTQGFKGVANLQHQKLL